MARELFESGALWNTFVTSGRAERFWDLARRYMPEQTALFEAWCRLPEGDASAALEALYMHLRAADFSRDVLQAAARLRVLRLADCGWNDWGTPARVLESLRGTRDLPAPWNLVLEQAGVDGDPSRKNVSIDPRADDLSRSVLR